MKVRNISSELLSENFEAVSLFCFSMLAFRKTGSEPVNQRQKVRELLTLEYSLRYR